LVGFKALLLICEGHLPVIKTIYVVEDDHNVRITIRAALENEGYQVLSATNGKDAISELSILKEVPNLIMTDLNMPFMNGEEFIAVLKQTPRFAEIPIMVVSAQKTNVSGICAFVTKPFNLENVLTLLQRHCL
jgi:CheY-like chemotaxis protein